MDEARACGVPLSCFWSFFFQSSLSQLSQRKFQVPRPCSRLPTACLHMPIHTSTPCLLTPDAKFTPVRSGPTRTQI